jgi:hypothetical protein
MIMFGDEIHFLTLRGPTGKAHKVEMWGSYGLVAPTLWTTNGNIRFLAERIWENLSVYTIEDNQIPVEAFDSQEALTEALRKFYYEHLREGISS